MALIKCSECGKEISDQATVCPNCGAPTHVETKATETPKKPKKEKKKGSCLGAILIVVGVLILIGILGSAFSSNDKVEKVDTEAQNDTVEETTEADAPTVFTVGETASLNDIEVTLVSAEESNGSQFLGPDEGNIYVNLTFEIVNNSDKDISVSSVLNFEAYCDDYSVNQSITGAASDNGGKNTLDGSVAAGKKMIGVIAYEVPADYQNLEVSFTPDFWTSKDIEFVVTK